MTDQKTLVQSTFNDDAMSWSDWAYDPKETYDLYPTGKARLATIRRELDRRHLGRKLRVLDAGCGTGDIALALEADGHTVYGVDFAPAMIDEARRRYSEMFPDRNDAVSRFVVGDVERFEQPEKPFDVMVAVGLIEYLATDDPFLTSLRRVLAKDGLLLIECRNRLFNALSANQYTADESISGELKALIAELETVSRFSPRPAADIPALMLTNPSALKKLPALAHIRDTPRKIGKTFPPGLTRRMFTPQRYEKVLSTHGFKMRHVIYYHMHGLPPVFEAHFPQIYNALSLALDTLGETPAGAYLGSCFIAVAENQ